jgi:hypothetical protein
MLTGRRFRLKVPTLGVEDGVEGRVAVTVPKDAILQVTSGPKPTDTRMVDVEWRGKRLVMFATDLRERGEEVDHSAA